MVKNRNLIKWPKTTFFSCYEDIRSISEAASDSKMSKNDKTPNFDKMAKNNVFFHVSKPPVRFPKPPATQKCLKMLKRRILIKWPKTTFFSCFEATCSISEAASDSKMSENDKAPNFDKMAKNNVFIHVSKPPVRFPKPPVTQKCLKMI